MKWVLPLFCIVAIAGLWTWALFAPKDPPPLPERFRGRFEFFYFEQPEGLVVDNPLPVTQKHFYTFREDGSYVHSAMVSGGYEMLRHEGIVSVDDRGILSLTQISTNRREDREETERFRVDWSQDDDGPILSLRHVEYGYTFLMRPVPEAAAEPASSGR